MKKIEIDNKVPENLRTGDDYNTTLNEMERNLARPEKVNRYGTHETGHLLYLIKTELISSPKDAVFAPPTIYIDDDGSVRQFSAAVTSNRIRLSDDSLVYTEELLKEAALASAAASEFEKELIGEDEDTAKAAAGDKAMLFAHCYKARSKDNIEFEGHTLWSSAQRDTLAWLQKNRAEVERLVGIAKQIIFNRCFGLKVELSKADFDAAQKYPEIESVLLLLLLESHNP